MATNNIRSWALAGALLTLAAPSALAQGRSAELDALRGEVKALSLRVDQLQRLQPRVDALEREVANLRREIANVRKTSKDVVIHGSKIDIDRPKGAPDSRIDGGRIGDN